MKQVRVSARIARGLGYGAVAVSLTFLACKREAPRPPAVAEDAAPVPPPPLVPGQRSDSRPLYILDGVMADNLSLGDIQALEFESMQVLNGAAAEAGYGDRGKNGVVLLTTKRYAATLGTMRGTVLDPSGKPAAMARVVIVGTTPVAVTDSTGSYSIAVPAGTYTVRAELGGFKPTEMAGVKILAGETLTADFRLAERPRN